MIRLFSSAHLVCLALVCCLNVLGFPAEARAQDFDVLVFSKTSGFRHGSISDGITAIQALAAANNFSVDTTEDAGQFTDANLAQYEAVIFLSTTGDILNSSQQGAFERYIQAGGGWVGVHSATDTEYGWPWYGDLIGNDAWFNGHPAVQTATLHREDPSHISTAHYPASFSFTDEWYNFRNNPRSVANVLVTIDENTYGGGNMGSDHPISWNHEFDGGRSFYTAMGHRSQTFQDANFRQHLLGAILWAAFQDNPCNDGDPCTDDIELPGGSCQNSPSSGAACEDGNPCTSQDTCSNGTCTGGSPTNCNDGNACTTDSCNPGSGCQSTLTVTCPSGEVCSASTGTCEVGLVCIAANDPSGNFNGAMTTGTQFTAGADSDPSLDNLTSPLAYANSNTNASNENSGDEVTYVMAVPATDTWFLWARMYYPSLGGINGPDSFFASLDGGSATKFGNNQDFHQTWHWDGNGNIEFGGASGLALGTVSAGNHSITIAKREVGSSGEQPRIDVLCFSRDGNTPPFDSQALAVLDITPQCTVDADCNDSNPCTNDSCSGTVCINAPNSVSCNDSNACTTNDQCSGGSCSGSAVNCNDGNSCTNDSCSTSSGCSNTPNSNSCSDGNACTSGDTCSGGSCNPGPPTNCDDSNACTTDSCSSGSGCQNTPSVSCPSGQTCSPSTGTCQAGIACVAAGDPSADFDGAMTTSTQFTGGADADPVRNNLSSPLAYANSTTNASNANSGDDVTYSLTVPGTGQWWLWARLYYPATPGENGANSFFASLDAGSADKLGNNSAHYQEWHWDGDGNVENGGLVGLALGTVSAGTHAVTIAKREVLPSGQQPRLDVLCVTSGASTPPDDAQVRDLLGIAAECTTASDCNDGNPCTNDSCSGASVCINAPNSASCNDLNACTTNDQCSGGSCVGGPPPNCNDSNACTTDFCSPGSGCSNTPNSNACSDGNACTEGDSCSGGSCVPGSPRNCIDGNACTDDSCNASSGCVHTNDDTNSCSNGVPGDDPDHCEAGVCLGTGGCAGNDAACDDSNPCTTDTCVGSGACSHSNNSGPCDDANDCTTNDSCSGGACSGGAPLDCADGNPCTDDGCNPGTGCTYTDNSAACDDANDCTTLDTCSSGSCFGGPAIDCEDGNLCTDTSCDRDAGCITTENSAVCDDGDVCTTGDVCSGGNCSAGALACEQASGASGNATTDSEQDGATPGDILETTVSSPTGGSVTIGETQIPILEVVVSAPAGSASDPMTVVFQIDGSLGASSNALVRFDGDVVASCSGAGAEASPDPCVSSRGDLPGGDVEIEVRSSSGGVWAISSAPSGCAAQPRSDCRQAEKGQFLIKNKVKSSADSMKWKWTKGDAVAMSDLGDPSRTTTYTLCVYDQEFGTAALSTALTVTPNPDWGLKGSSGWKYKDKARARSGVQTAQIATGVAGRTKASVKARGESMPIPDPQNNAAYFHQDPAVTVQLTNSEGVCWSTEFTTASKNTGGLFKAKSP